MGNKLGTKTKMSLTRPGHIIYYRGSGSGLDRAGPPESAFFMCHALITPHIHSNICIHASFVKLKLCKWFEYKCLEKCLAFKEEYLPRIKFLPIFAFSLLAWNFAEFGRWFFYVQIEKHGLKVSTFFFLP